MQRHQMEKKEGDTSLEMSIEDIPQPFTKKQRSPGKSPFCPEPMKKLNPVINNQVAPKPSLVYIPKSKQGAVKKEVV